MKRIIATVLIGSALSFGACSIESTESVPSTTTTTIQTTTTTVHEFIMGKCWVNGYVRKNGTQVSGYYRDC